MDSDQEKTEHLPSISTTPTSELTAKPASQSTLIIPVDSEHTALRFSIVGIFVVGWVISFLLLSLIFPSDGFNFLAVLLSLVITALVSQQIERQLKRRWPSGRSVRVDASGIRLLQNERPQESIDASQSANLLLWRFVVKKRSHVPKGWSMMACGLEQNGRYLPVYTFMSADDVNKLPISGKFTLLKGKKEEDEAKKKQSGALAQRDDLWLAGEQRRLRQAEEQRWTQGAEMNSADFLAYLRQLQTQFPQWFV
jgi:hypothetical protein